MVRSLNPRHNDNRTMPGRSATNAETGRAMARALRRSQERLGRAGNLSARTQPARAAQRLVTAAERTAAHTGRDVDDLLTRRTTHRPRLQESSFISHGPSELAFERSTHAERVPSTARAMAAQDARRRSMTFSGITTAAARAVTGRSNEDERRIVAVPRHVGTSSGVLARPAQAHGTLTPWADHARDHDRGALQWRGGQRVMALKYNPSNQGGMHNPISL